MTALDTIAQEMTLANILKLIPTVEGFDSKIGEHMPTNATISCPNGMRISIGFGPFHYGSNRDFGAFASFNDLNTDELLKTATTFEIAVFDTDDEFIPLTSGDDVMGWVDCEQLLNLLVEIKDGTRPSIFADPHALEA